MTSPLITCFVLTLLHCDVFINYSELTNCFNTSSKIFNKGIPQGSTYGSRYSEFKILLAYSPAKLMYFSVNRYRLKYITNDTHNTFNIYIQQFLV